MMGQPSTFSMTSRPSASSSARSPPPKKEALGRGGRGAFLVARDGRWAVGCGALRLLDATTAEVKRMYVRAPVRGQGIADALVARLAQEALGAGLVMLRLETGIHQKAAIRFYERCGFAHGGRLRGRPSGGAPAGSPEPS